jgi:glucose/arabinose dehydrogenase
MHSRIGTVVVPLVAVGLLVLAACTTEGTSTSTSSGGTANLATSVPTTDAPSTDASSTTQAPEGPLTLDLAPAGSGFDAPVLLVADPDGGPDLVVEQTGRIVRNDLDHSVVADLTGDITYGGEKGLLGLAFHPNFDVNRLAYVNYVDGAGDTVIAEFTVTSDGFDLATRRIIVTVDQPAGNHNGGMIAFGPDGYLWIGMGDGGGADDRYGQAQDASTLLGAMLRLDVGPDTDGPYDLPDGNAFVDSAGAPEVWAVGLRNPWRFSFDGDNLWIGDVGQNDVEEVDVVNAGSSGLNLGWPVMEGSDCFGADDCDPSPFVLPTIEYRHDEGCSITGGYVYRGESSPQLQGHYFFSDYCSGFIRSFSPDTGVIDWTPSTGALANVSSFGIGGDGELYVISLSGAIFRIESS